MTKIRKDQNCRECGTVIPKGTDVHSETKWTKDGRPFSIYVCNDCIKIEKTDGWAALAKCYADQIAKDPDAYN